MLNIEEKISYFENNLNKIEENFADSFRCDIIFFFGDFTSENELLVFLNKIETIEEIENWISKLTSRIIMKFDSSNENLNDFIYDYLNYG